MKDVLPYKGFIGSVHFSADDFALLCTNTDEKIKWTYKNEQKAALSFFIEKIATEQSYIYAKARKVFDIQIYKKDKYKYTYPDIEKYLK